MSEVVILPLLQNHFNKSLKLQSNRLRACCEAVRGGGGRCTSVRYWASVRGDVAKGVYVAMKLVIR